MATIDLRKYPNVVATGDCHGNFRSMVNSICEQHRLENTLVVVCGDIGMGFCKKGYYSEEFDWMQKHLAKKNDCLVMFRGNHDNPSYFCESEYAEFQHCGAYPNVFLVDDYTILDTVRGKILCIGGATSVDRSARTEDISWWRGEKFQMPDESDYLEIEKNDVTIVCTHTCPKCCGPLFDNAMGYEMYDKFLMSELQNERLDLLEVFDNLRKDHLGNGECLSKNPIRLWMYGHFHGHFSDDVFGTKFVGLDMIRPNQGGADIYELR